MIRRWSHINNINGIVILRLKFLPETSTSVNVRSSRYFKKKQFSHTKLTRLQWSKRKHLTSWFFFTNVLKLWSLEYNFYRKYNTSIYSKNIFKINFTTFNTTLLTHFKYSSNSFSEERLVTSFYPQLSFFHKNFFHKNSKFLLLNQLFSSTYLTKSFNKLTKRNYNEKHSTLVTQIVKKQTLTNFIRYSNFMQIYYVFFTYLFLYQIL